MQDENDQPLTGLHYTLAPGQVSAVSVVKVMARAGLRLIAEDSDAARVLARRSGTADAFQDLADSPISLTPWAGTWQTFDIKVEAGAIAIAGAAVRVRASNRY